MMTSPADSKGASSRASAVTGRPALTIRKYQARVVEIEHQAGEIGRGGNSLRPPAPGLGPRIEGDHLVTRIAQVERQIASHGPQPNQADLHGLPLRVAVVSASFYVVCPVRNSNPVSKR